MCLPSYYDKHEISIYVALFITHYTGRNSIFAKRISLAAHTA